MGTNKAQRLAFIRINTCGGEEPEADTDTGIKCTAEQFQPGLVWGYSEAGLELGGGRCVFPGW